MKIDWALFGLVVGIVALLTTGTLLEFDYRRENYPMQVEKLSTT